MANSKHIRSDHAEVSAKMRADITPAITRFNHYSLPSILQKDYKSVDLPAVTEHLPPEIDKSRKLNSREHPGIITTAGINANEGIAYLCIGGKRFGVEPGFEAIEYNQEFIDTFLRNYDEDKNFKIFIQTLMSKANLSSELLPKEILKEITRPENNILETFGQYIQQKNSDLFIPFSIWMFKQDYEIKSNGEVFIPPSRAEGLGRTDIRGSSSRIKENLNALRECLANDIAIAAGYNVQQQHLVQSRYPNGKLKLMTACKLQRGYQDISKAFTIRGDTFKPEDKKGLFENYLTLKSDSHVGAKSINVPFTGTLLALSSFVQDPDFMGAYGQNKGIVDNQPFIIDLGKAFRPDFLTEIVSTLQDNGQFSQKMEDVGIDPIRRHVIYRNNSVLYDVPFIENMIGFHMLNKMVNGVEPSPEVTNSYNIAMKEVIEAYISRMAERGEEITWDGDDLEQPFTAIMKKVKPGALNGIFDNYEKVLNEMLATQMSSSSEIKEIQNLMQEVAKAKATAQASAEKILSTFAHRLQLPADQVTLLSNLEKLTTPKIRDTSPDNTVILSHLQVDRKSRIPWSLVQEQALDGKPTGRYKLICDLDKNSDLSIFTSKSQTLADARERLHAYLESINSGIELNDFYQQGSKLIFNVQQPTLDKLMAAISEKQIHEYRIPFSTSKKTIELAHNALDSFTNEIRKAGFRGFFKNDVGNERRMIYLEILSNNASKPPALQLVTLLGLLDSSSKDLKKTILQSWNLKPDQIDLARQRLQMLITNELLKADYTHDEIDTFLVTFKNQFSELNKVIESKDKNSAAIQKSIILSSMTTQLNHLIPQSNEEMTRNYYSGPTLDP